jgi:Protein of unknown function (DUF3175)
MATRRRKKSARKTAAARRGSARAARKAPRRYWSREVTRRSDALDVEEGVFKLPPAEMARSLKRSAERSDRRKCSPFRSALSVLTFFENRAGRNLSASRRKALERAKQEIRRIFGREPTPA